jgi:hypothetical protein
MGARQTAPHHGRAFSRQKDERAQDERADDERAQKERRP